MRKFITASIAMLVMFTSLAQKTTSPKSSAEGPKPDVILKVNGDELSGKVTGISDSIIQFIYSGESLSYSIRKEDILKITFSSGRIEFFNRPALSSEKQADAGTARSSTEDHHNKVAILPFSFIKDNQSTGAEMSYKAQNDAYTYLNKHAAGLTMVDPRTTNALLAKKGITRENMMASTMDEICDILGVEYLVEGTITQNKAAQTTSSSGALNAKTDNKNDKTKTNVSTYNNSASYQYYSTHVAINVYTDKNANIYNQERRALINTTDGSYDSPLEYILKRCPLYRK